VIALQTSGIDYARLRHAGRDVLSLALIDARNRTLAWAALLEEAPGEILTLGGGLPPAVAASLDPPLWTLGAIGWFQEYWIGRNVQRGRGEAADAQGPRLASILPSADALYDPATVARPTRRGLAADGLPDLQATRQYLVESLETTLDLLDGMREEDDAALYFHRLALFHEEMRLEDFAVLAQTLGVPVGEALLPRVATFAPRPPQVFPATRWLLGADAPGFVFDNERAPHPVAIPEFEIDAQAVTWAQYGEFVEDGGYDEPAHWSEAGRTWVEREVRRTPRHVDQMRHGVLRHRFGQLSRVAGAEPAVHVSAFEAEAWCRWAGRRLPTEAQWECAALSRPNEFRWGDVWEWTASAFQPFPGFAPHPYRDYSAPWFDGRPVLRGASFMTQPRMRHPRYRNFFPAHRNDVPAGFRTCAM
jgi:ergothioneine biosynthesis protein EgtB